jgi:hypothetical protein
MANVPVNIGGVMVTAGSTITGSFYGMLALAGGPSASILGLKYINGYSVSNIQTNPTYSSVEATISSFGVANGSKLELLITSCSLSAGSSPIFLYT